VADGGMGNLTLFLSMVVGALAAGVTFVALRGDLTTQGVMLRAGASFLAFSLLVWSFARLPWHWSAIAVLAAALAGSAAMVRARDLPDWTESVLIFISIAVGIYLWTTWWP
jgi:hypothetical protein